MKNLRSGLYILVLASVICLFIPGRAVAQDDGDVPCCHTPPGITASASGVVQPGIQLSQTANNDLAIDAQSNPADTPVPDHLSLTASAITGKATEIPLVKEESWTPGYIRQS
jgi:hypothetical protein